MAPGKSSWRKKNARSARAAPHITRSGSVEESGQASTAEDLTSAVTAITSPEHADQSQVEHYEIVHENEIVKTIEGAREIGSGAEDDASLGEHEESSQTDEDREDTEATGNAGRPGELLCSQEKQQESQRTGTQVEILKPITLLAGPGGQVSSQEDVEENTSVDSDSNAADVSCSSEAAGQYGDSQDRGQENIHVGTHDDATVTRHGIVVATMRRLVVPSSAIFLPPPPCDSEVFVRAVIEAIKAGSIRTGYSLLYAYARSK